MSADPLRPAPAWIAQPPVEQVRKLVEQSGFVVYEPGTTIFDESVLVYVARPRRQEWPGFDVYDHVGRPLATIRRLAAPGFPITAGPCEVADPNGRSLLRIEPRYRPFKKVFDVSGTAGARFSASTTSTFAKLKIEANREPFGSVRGDRILGLRGSRLTIHDHALDPVGSIHIPGKVVSRKRIESYVVQLGPQLTGPFRQLIVAAPAVLTVVRRAQHQG